MENYTMFGDTDAYLSKHIDPHFNRMHNNLTSISANCAATDNMFLEKLGHQE